MFRTNTYRWMALPIMFIVAAGCGSKMAAVPLRGTVKLDGRPLANATVYFIADGSGGRDAVGITNADGQFRLSTLKSGDGALPGRYKVAIQPIAPAESGPAPTNPREAMWAVSRQPSRPAIVLPPRYSQPDQTILVQDVPANGNVVFELQSR